MLINYSYIIDILVLTTGLYLVLTSSNLLKKIIGLAIIQAAIILFFVIMGKSNNSIVPVLKCLNFAECPTNYTHPLPQVLMLTAIVVGIATLAVALSLLILIKEKYQTIDETIIEKLDDN